jgi:hypothetical protein
MHNWLIPGGGLCAGTGLILMLFGFEASTGQDFASSFSQVGYTGLDNFAASSSGMAGIGLLLVGVVLLIAGNRTAWTKTDGY